MYHLLFSLIIFLYMTTGIGLLINRWAGLLNTTPLAMHLAMGLAAIPVLGIVFNFVHIPIHYSVFLIIATLGFLLWLSKKPWRKTCSWDLPKIGFFIIILSILGTMYCYGPFVYPWLEDDDSWGHAASVKYIAITKQVDAPIDIFQYLNPYPPGYGIILALMHQTHPSLSFTIKFFNGLIIILGYLFFYELVKEMTKNSTKAAWATFFLTVITCYLSHFIWAHSLIVTLFFPAFYWLRRAETNKNILLISALTIAAIFVIQPTKSVKFIALGILAGISFWISKRRWPKHIVISLFLGLVISQLWWAPVIHRFVTGRFHIVEREFISKYDTLQTAPRTKKLLKDFFSPTGGTATRAYTFEDYIFVPDSNMINNPTGVGSILCLLAFWGLIDMIHILFKRKKEDGDDQPLEDQKQYALFTIFWLIFTFLGTNTKTFHLPIGLYAFRFWMLFAIPVCILAAECTSRMMKLMELKALRYFVIILIISSVWLTTGRQKLDTNTSLWPWGVDWGSYEELQGYLWMKDHFPANTRVFAFTKNHFVLGVDMRADFWTEGYRKDFANAIDLPLDELYQRLKKHRFEYLVLGQREVKELGLEKVNSCLREIKKTPDKFHFIYGPGNGARIYQIL